eukprot:157664-Amphidinium_carterae.1
MDYQRRVRSSGGWCAVETMPDLQERFHVSQTLGTIGMHGHYVCRGMLPSHQVHSWSGLMESHGILPNPGRYAKENALARALAR